MRFTIKAKLTLAFGFLDRMFPKFFMTDAIPENTQRFADSLAAAKAHAVKFFNAQSPMAPAPLAAE